MEIFGKGKTVAPNGDGKAKSHLSFRDIIGRILDLRTNPALNYVILALLGIVVGLVSLLLGATVFSFPMFWSYFDSPILILLNILPPVVLIFLVYFISGRAWIAFSFPSLIVLALSIIGFFKIQVRGDPFLAVDFTYVMEAGNILSSYTLTMNWKIFMTAVVFVCGVLFSVFALKHRPKKPLFRTIGAVSLIALSVVMYSAVYTSTEIYAEISGDQTGTEWSSARSYISRGFLYPFIHSIKDAAPSTPDWYDAQEAREALESYIDSDIPDNKKVDVISIFLEAYSDLSQFNVLDFSPDVYSPLHRLQAESVSGTIVSNVFAGNTIDTERLFLTGNTHLTSYRTATNSYVHYLKTQNYHTEGLHAGDVWFYDRRPVNANLGFDEYYFLEDFENGSRSDSFFFPTVMDLYQSRDRNMPYFSFNLSYQNHGAYESAWTQEPYVISQGGLSDESYNILNNYLSGIYDTNLRLESFIDSLRTTAEPVVVLVAGDHMPWLGNFNATYNELGINIDISSEDGFYNYYSTPYIIWANDAAKLALGNDFAGDGGSLSPCFLMGELFSQCSWEGDGYMQALRELKSSIDIINSATGIKRLHGTLTRDLPPDAAAAYMRLRSIEHYRLENFKYKN